MYVQVLLLLALFAAYGRVEGKVQPMGITNNKNQLRMNSNYHHRIDCCREPYRMGSARMVCANRRRIRFDCIVPPTRRPAYKTVRTVVLKGNKAEERIRSRGYMQSEFEINDKGTVKIKSQVRNRHRTRGFTGGMNLYLFDANGNKIWESQLHQIGVNARFLGGTKRSSRAWTEKIPMSLLSKIHKYNIYQRHTPTNRFWKWVKTHVKDIVKAAKTIVKIIKYVKKNKQ